MSKCPECDGELVRSDTKKKGMQVLKHKDPAAAKTAGCGMGFITVRSKGAANNDGKKEKGTATQEQGGGNAHQQPASAAGGYRESVAAAKRGSGRGKSGGRSSGKSAQHVQQPAQQPASAASTGPKRKSGGILDGLSDFVRGNW